MREIASRCPRCGRVRHLAADNWADLPDKALDEPCPNGCEPSFAVPSGPSPARQQAGIGPWLLLAVLVLAPAVAVVEALSA